MPESKVWLRFEGNKVNADGTRKKYKIVSVDNEQLKNAILSYGKTFSKEEPTNKALKTTDITPELLKPMLESWARWMDEGYSVACLTDDSEAKLVGFNINFLQIGPPDMSRLPKDIFQGTMRVQIEAIVKIKNQVNMKEKYGVDRYMDAMGLYVIPECRGEGIGKYLLEARKLICKHHGIKVTANTFSSEPARKQAAKVGFKVFSEMKMRDYKTVYGLDIDCAEDETIKFMGMVIE